MRRVNPDKTIMFDGFKLVLEPQEAWDTLHENRVALFTSFIVIFVVYRLLLVYDHDKREPTLIKPWIPIIGHAINIYRLGSRHFVTIA